MKRLNYNVRRISLKLGIYKWVRLAVLKILGDHSLQDDLVFFRVLLHPGNKVFDVGANRGQSAEIFLRAGCEVIAFEPQHHLHEEISQVCKGLGKLTIEGDGLGKTKEEKTLFLTEFDQTSSFRDDWDGVRIGEKTAILSTLDEKIALYGKPHYCKIDVEGWEEEVLSGLSQPIPIISFEFHTCKKELSKTEAVINKINNLGSYSFNIRLSGASTFHLPEFLTSEKFSSAFRESLGKNLIGGFGDIFCIHN